MIITEKKHVEDCFDGSTVWGYAFDAPWTKTEILKLSVLGKLEYYEEFPRPFFRLLGATGITVKGVQGGNTCRAVYPINNKEVAIQSFESHFDVLS